MNRSALVSVLLGMASIVGLASASEPTHPNVDAQSIRVQQAAIRAEILSGAGRYQQLDLQSRDAILEHQNRLAVLLRNVDRTTDLPERRQIDVFNTLESISAIINRDPDGRMVCWRERPVGSNRLQTACMTVAQMRKEREASQMEIARRDQR